MNQEQIMFSLLKRLIDLNNKKKIVIIDHERCAELEDIISQAKKALGEPAFKCGSCSWTGYKHQLARIRDGLSIDLCCPDCRLVRTADYYT